MATYTVANLPRISREKLAEMIRARTAGITIIDVRDSDFIGGHIIGCKNVPTNQHDYRMPELARTLKDQDTVVFHCALSQQRGPAGALRYLRERARLTQSEGSGSSGADMSAHQKVYVLDGGFTKWQELYGDDKDLTEGYIKDLWED